MKIVTVNRQFAFALLAAFLVVIRVGPMRADEAGVNGGPRFVDASSHDFPPVNVLDNQQELSGFGHELATAVIEAVGGTVAHIHSPIWTDEILLVLGAAAISLLLFAIAFVAWSRTLRLTVARQTAELRASEARFSDFAEISTDWFWEMGADLRLTYLSERFFEITGLRPEDQIGAIRHGSEEASDSEDLEKKWTDHRAALAARDSFKNFEYQIVSGMGRDCYIRVSGKPIFDADGAFLGYRGTGSDITERKQANLSLQYSEKRLAGVLDSSAEAIISVNLEQTILMFNKGAEAVFGYAADEVLGKHLGLLMPERYRGAHRVHIDEFKGTRNASRLLMGNKHEIKGLHRNGVEFPAEASISKLDIGDERIFMVNLRDISDRQRIETQLGHAQKMEALGQLTGGIAHDFNNLLAAVLGHAELLKDQLGEDNKSVDVLIRTANRGAELTHRLLAFSRRQTLQPQVIDVGKLIANVTDLMHRIFPENIEVETALEAGCWSCEADQAQMENALLNLAINARDAMPSGGRLIIKTRNIHIDADYTATPGDLTPGDYVRLSVSDTGVGITPDILDNVFDPFFTTKDVGEGSGLGLSMVYGFVKQSGGHVTVCSEAGMGTTVNLYLPMSTATPHRANDPVISKHQTGRGKVVLVVEDEPEVRSLVVEMLRRLGYDAREAKDGDEALAALERDSEIDLLITDVMLPGGKNGPEIAEEARGFRPNMKYLFMSGYSPKSMPHRNWLPAGAALLNKPFTRHELALQLRAVLD